MPRPVLDHMQPHNGNTDSRGPVQRFAVAAIERIEAPLQLSEWSRFIEIHSTR